MARKRLTQIFPFLLPLRVWQKNLFFRITCYFDKNIYAKRKGDLLSYECSNAKTLMINDHSGYDILYQVNKVDNLKLTSKTLNKILIYPSETFSFCLLMQVVKKYGRYKDGLVLIDGKIVAKKGGGICQISNLLYYLFLMSPLTVVERHGHKLKSLPNNESDALDGIDATINSGWLDLKVRNDTNDIYQIVIDFDDDYMYGRLLTNNMPEIDYEIINSNLKYFSKDDKIYESVSVVRVMRDKKTHEIVKSENLYDEVVQVTYKLPDDIVIEKR